MDENLNQPNIPGQPYHKHKRASLFATLFIVLFAVVGFGVYFYYQISKQNENKLDYYISNKTHYTPLTDIINNPIDDLSEIPYISQNMPVTINLPKNWQYKNFEPTSQSEIFTVSESHPKTTVIFSFGKIPNESNKYLLARSLLGTDYSLDESKIIDDKELTLPSREQAYILSFIGDQPFIKNAVSIVAVIEKESYVFTMVGITKPDYRESLREQFLSALSTFQFSI